VRRKPGQPWSLPAERPTMYRAHKNVFLVVGNEKGLLAWMIGTSKKPIEIPATPYSHACAQSSALCIVALPSFVVFPRFESSLARANLDPAFALTTTAK